MVVHTQYQANPIVSCGDEGNSGALLFNPDTDDAAVVNPTGRDLWFFAAVPRSMTELATFLTTSYRGVDPEKAAEDAAAFVETLAPDFMLTIEKAE